jgi:hypothetical protein
MILFNGVSNKCWFIVLLISGKCECALFGDYVDELNKKMGKSATGLPIFVQFPKVKIFRGNVLCLLNLYFLIIWLIWLFS